MAKKGVNLTPAGESVLVHCDRVLNSIEDIKQEANRCKSLGGGKVRISAFRGAAAQLLPKIRAEFQTEYPQIEVQIVEEKDCPQVEQMVYEGKADIGITILPTSKNLATIEVLRDNYIVLLPPNLKVDRNSDRITWTQLLALPIISYPDCNSCFKQIESYFATAGTCI